MKINQQVMQTDVDRITEWARTWKMSLNVDKTKVMVLSSNPEETKWEPVLLANGRRIKVTSENPFLGFQAGNNLRGKEHIDKSVTKASKQVCILRCLSSKDWAKQRNLYIGYTRQLMEYVSPDWNGLISPTQRKRLQKYRNKHAEPSDH